MAADGDTAQDIYLRSGTTTTLVTDRVQAGSDSSDGAIFDALSAGGSRVMFATAEPLVAADGDTAQDIYLFENGALTLLSDRVQPGADNPLGVTFRAATDDARGVVFTTSEPIMPGDSDTSTDVFVAKSGADGDDDPALGPRPGRIGRDRQRQPSKTRPPSGNAVAFTTTEPLLAADGDTAGKRRLRQPRGHADARVRPRSRRAPIRSWTRNRKADR